MPVTNNHMYPSKEEERKPIFVDNIENTTGIWLRQHIEYGLVELWHNGIYITSHQSNIVGFNMNPTVAIALMGTCIDIGKRQRSAEIMALLK